MRIVSNNITNTVQITILGGEVKTVTNAVKNALNCLPVNSPDVALLSALHADLLNALEGKSF